MHGTNENFMESQHVNIFQSLPNTRISMWVQLSGAQIHSGADEVELFRAILDAISMPVFSNTFPTLRDLQRG